MRYEDMIRPFTNSTGATLLSGDLVQLPDGKVGIVEGLAGVRNGAQGMCRTSGVVTCDKLTATVIAAAARIAYNPTTKMCIGQVGAATLPAFIIGRAIAAAGSGPVTVDVALNDQGPTI
jgi:predicted RecA/RadA family phage recombinase